MAANLMRWLFPAIAVSAVGITSPLPAADLTAAFLQATLPHAGSTRNVDGTTYVLRSLKVEPGRKPGEFVIRVTIKEAYTK